MDRDKLDFSDILEEYNSEKAAEFIATLGMVANVLGGYKTQLMHAGFLEREAFELVLDFQQKLLNASKKGAG